MGRQGPELAWLDARETVTVTELSRACALSPDELGELVEYGALVPVIAQPPETTFSAEWVMPLREAGKLRRDYDLDLFAVALLLDYLHRIDDLEDQLRSLQAHVQPLAAGDQSHSK
jgi:chaperone modulatory protein CbpM